MGLLRNMSTVLVLAFGSLASCVTQTGSQTIANMTVKPRITVFNDTHAEWKALYPVLVSGTNVEALCGVDVFVGELQPYVDAQFWQWTIKIDNETVSEGFYFPTPLGGGGGSPPAGPGPLSSIPGPGGPPPQQAAVYQQYQPPDIRFASNHFANGSSHTITLEVDVLLYEMVGGVKTSTGHCAASVQFQFFPYNKLMAWKTARMVSGSTWPPTVQGYIDATVTEGKTEFAAAHYADLRPSMASDLQQIRDGLWASSAVFANCHGYDVGLYITEGYPGVPPNPGSGPDTAISWVEIGTLTNLAGHRRPPHSWVLLYACDSLRSLNPVPSFNVRGVDGCYLGFGRTIMPMVRDKSKLITDPDAFPSLAMHPEALFARLNEGYCAQLALSKTQAPSGFVPQHSPSGNLVDKSDWEDEPMQLRNDGLTTWASVYLYADERNYLADEQGRFTEWSIELEKWPLWP